jgi:hypothetical protein
LLKFGTQELSWRYACVVQLESRGAEQAHYPSEDNRAIVQNTNLDAQARNIYKNWTSIVEDYTRRKLSKQSDKLPAMAGLASVVQIVMGDAYIAGVWHQKAVWRLLWMHVQNKRTCIRRKDFLAPTWSWASVDGAICFLRQNIESHCRVAKFPPSQGLGTMYVETWMLRMEPLRRHHFGSDYGKFENFKPWKSLAASLKTYLDNADAVPTQYRRGTEGDPQELVGSWFLLLAATADDNVGDFAGLIVLPVNGTYNQYKRIDMFKCFPLPGFSPDRASNWKGFLKWNRVQMTPRIRSHFDLVI